MSSETMRRVLLEIKESRSLSQEQQVSYLSYPPPASHQSLRTDGWELSDRISPSVLLVITILAAIFFVSGLLHLLVRLLLRPQNREAEDSDNITALQGQLQQLFHLHDSGVDQSFIDTLPVFLYKSIIGVKDPFDCAVCLCEFEPSDRLRLLPKCSHAFHMECIDTWLLSHSTCPLCRASLLPDLSPNSSYSPILHVLESGGESSQEIAGDRVISSVGGRSSWALRTNSNLGPRENIASNRFDHGDKSCEIGGSDDVNTEPERPKVDSSERFVLVKLGKLRSSECGESSCNSKSVGSIVSNKNENVDSRRCLSMGSFEYVVDDDSKLHIAVNPKSKTQHSKKKTLLPLAPGHKPVMSECDFGSQRGFRLESIRIAEEPRYLNSGGNSGNTIKKKSEESFSISKIWLRGGHKQRQNGGEEDPSGRRAVSFRIPISQEDAAVREKSGNGESGCENLNSLQEKTPSFARRTLLWLVGRQNKSIQDSWSAPNA